MRGWGPLLITFDLMNACMQGSTHSHVLLGQVVSCYNYSALLSTSLLPAASPFSASQFLKTYEDEFVEVVNAKQSLLKLRRKGGNTAKLPLQLMATRECRNLGGK